jgi:hypothetical protein
MNTCCAQTYERLLEVMGNAQICDHGPLEGPQAVMDGQALSIVIVRHGRAHCWWVTKNIHTNMQWLFDFYSEDEP